MNYKEALKIIKACQPVNKVPEKETGFYLLSENVNQYLFADLLNIYYNIEKGQKILTGYGSSVQAKVAQPKEKEMEIKEKKEVKEIKQEKEIEKAKTEIVEKVEKPKVEEVKKGIKEEKKEEKAIEIKKEKAIEMKKEEIKPITLEEIKAKKEIEFKKEKEVATFKIEVPSRENALREAEERVKSLTKTESVSKSELSAKLVKLTTEMIREKQADRKIMLKTEIERIKEMIKAIDEGKQVKEDVNKAIETMIKADIEKAVSTLKTITEANREKVPYAILYKTLEEAVNGYREYLTVLHSEIIKKTNASVALPSYKELYDLLDHYKELGKLEVEKGKSKEEIKEKINNMKEAVLLHELSLKDKKAFLAYTKGEITKEEALKRAKIILAVNLGLSEDEARKMF
jgi:myosin heavy subunit